MRRRTKCTRLFGFKATPGARCVRILNGSASRPVYRGRAVGQTSSCTFEIETPTIHCRGRRYHSGTRRSLASRSGARARYCSDVSSCSAAARRCICAERAPRNHAGISHYGLAELTQEGFDRLPIAALPIDCVRHGAQGPSAVLTFDDGSTTITSNMLGRSSSSAEIPWTIFVTTEFADGRGRLWWLELERAIARLDRLVVPRNGEVFNLPSRTLDEKQAAFHAVHRELRAGPMERLRTVTADLASQAGIISNCLAAEIYQLGRTSRFGTRARRDDRCTYAIAPCPREARHDCSRREITESKAILERRLGRPIRHFAYPFGDRISAGELGELRLVRDSRFATAMTSRPGHLFSDHANYLNALPRVSINGLFQNRAALRALFSGVPFLLWNRGRVAEIET